MKEGPDIAQIAALIGDPARANVLTALMHGKALTASELSFEAGVTLQTASSHLAKLLDAGLLRARKQGRHKYFSLSNDQVAHVLEGLMGLAANAGHLRTRTGPRDAVLRKAKVLLQSPCRRYGNAPVRQSHDQRVSPISWRLSRLDRAWARIRARIRYRCGCSGRQEVAAVPRMS